MLSVEGTLKAREKKTWNWKTRDWKMWALQKSSNIAGVQHDVNTSRKRRRRDADVRLAAALRRSVTIGGGGVSKMSAPAAHSSSPDHLRRYRPLKFCMRVRVQEVVVYFKFHENRSMGLVFSKNRKSLSRDVHVDVELCFSVWASSMVAPKVQP